MHYRTIPFALAVLLALASPAKAQQEIFPGLFEDELIDALVQTYSTTSALSEAASKDTLYAVVDRVTVDEQDGTVGLYTGLFVPFDCDPVCDPSQDVFNEGSGLNQEHVWPRSQGAGSGLAERDMHHLFPSRVVVNSTRGNLPFGESPDEETTAWYYLDQQQTTPPADDPDAWSELLSNVLLEPREDKKGDVARALFYFYTMYGPAGTGQADEAFFEAMKETLLAWHEADLPTAEEVARSERVAVYQETGSGEPAINPFVHDATLARRTFFGRVLYVRQGTDLDPALQTGGSWASAFGDLQDALDARLGYLIQGFVDEVWVAAGTYRPTKANSEDPRDAVYRLTNGLSLYGGFAGTEGSPDERDWEINSTVLSGDIGVEGDISDNAYTVVRVRGAEDAVLDGFIITGGRGEGAGVFADEASLTIRRCRIEGNRSPEDGGGLFLIDGTYELEDVVVADNFAIYDGGGLFTTSATVRVSDSAFEGNTSLNGDGAAISAGASDLEIISSTFEANTAERRGGGVFITEGTLTVSGSTFSGNAVVSAGSGGAISALAAEVSVRSSTFADNTADPGGAIHARGESLSVDGSDFIENVSATSGGAIDIERAALTVTQSMFSGNAAQLGGAVALELVNFDDRATILLTEFVGNEARGSTAAGGALFLNMAFAHVDHALFAGNTAEATSSSGTAVGGAISLGEGSIELFNSTVADNAATVPGGDGDERGGGLWIFGSVDARNSVLWGNAGGEITEGEFNEEAGGEIDIGRSIVMGGYEGPDVLDADPLFVSAEDGDYRLREGSPAVDFGLAEFLPADDFDLDDDGDTAEPLPYDLDGDERVQGNAVDLGPYESPYEAISSILYVDAEATGAADGSSWANAFTDLQEALHVADTLDVDGLEVWVAEGIYYPTDDDTQYVSFEPSRPLYGGFAGTEATLEERDWEAHPTVLSGDIGVPGDYSDNSDFVVSVPGGRSTLIDGFVITGARQSNGGSIPFHRGAAIRASLGGSSFDSLTVRRCAIERNAGSGIALFRTTARFEDVSFELNEAGIRAARSNVTVERGSWYRNQTAASFRAGIARLRDAHFTGNGQALAIDSDNGGADVTVQDAVFEHHGPFDMAPVGSVSARSVVGAYGSSVSIVNARFEGNEVYETTAPIAVDGSEVELTNVTFVGNYGGRAGAIAVTGQEVTARFTNVAATANSGSEAGSVLIRDYIQDVQVRNSILWGNGESDGVPEYVASGLDTEVMFAHTIVDGGCEPDDYVSCDAVLDGLPVFAALPAPGDDGEWGTGDDDYGDLRLQEGSPAIDHGLAEFLPADESDLDGDGDTSEPIPFDLDGGERVQGSAVDLGPYESPFAVSNESTATTFTDGITTPYPNPTTGQATVQITLDAPRTAVTIEIIDVLGRRVAVLHDGPLAAGEHSLSLDGRSLPAGVYVVRLLAGELVLTHLFTIVR